MNRPTLILSQLGAGTVSRSLLQIAGLVLVLLVSLLSVQAQVTTGVVRGIVHDPTGAVVSGANVMITNNKTNVRLAAQTTGNGEYQFSDLIPGEYTLTVEAPNFKKLTLSDVRVELNQTTDVPTQLQVGGASEVIEVSAGGVELVDTTTTTLSKSFNEKQVVDLAQTNIGGAFGGGVNNLALLAPNVVSSGGVGVGTGGSVGGQRSRNNNFVVDGVDNNDKSVTGPQIYVSPDFVSEFSLLANQFSAEFGHSNGGQFITVTRSGTNEYHGTAYAFIQNRYLNALDTLQKNAGVIRQQIPGKEDDFMPRSDFGRFGGNLGGPILKNRLFFFGGYERIQTGDAASAGGLTAPTEAGLAVIGALPGISTTNFNVFKQYVPVAPTNDAETIPFCALVPTGGHCPGDRFVDIPVGFVNFPAPNYSNNNNFVINIDFAQNDRMQHRGRFIYNDYAAIDTGASLPQFFVLTPIENRLFSYTFLYTISPKMTNETRLAYRRSVQSFPVPAGITFPGLDTFPNLGLNDLGFDIGPNGNFPQFGIENNYQFVNNTTYLKGNHSLKFGIDFRNIISPQSFVQRERGDYQYSATDFYMRDLSPDFLGERTVGASPYYGNQQLVLPFIQDDWRIRPNLTLNLGVNYSYQGVTEGAKLQSLNEIASVPGLIEFFAPRAQTANFGPKIGIAWSPNFSSGNKWLGRAFGTSGQSSVRAGFSMGYDYIFDNLYILALPPQANQTVDTDVNAYTPNFLADGAIPNTPVTGTTTPAVARSVTSAFIPDQEVPYAMTWSLSFQRQFKTDWSLELRYLGTRGVHLLTQNRINVQNKVSPTLGGLPTFLIAPTQAQIDALPLTLAQIDARSNLVPAYEAAGFEANIVGFMSNGNSNYQAFSAALNRRFAYGFMLTAAYTWSHLIDDTTAEVFSTVLSPRRVEDFQNLRADKADSALDRRHRFVLSGIYELPFFKSGSALKRTLLGGFNIAGTLTFESGERATVLSGIDSNLNGDAAADRTILNPIGISGRDSIVTALLKTCTEFNPIGTCAQSASQRTVGYLANDPTAQYIQAGRGAVATTGRNTLPLPGIENFDFSVFKNFAITESKYLQFRVDFFNFPNHPQYIPGSPNAVVPLATTGVSDVNTVGRNAFNTANEVFSSNPRVIQMALRFNF
ncbi:MAG: carboxypeptidase-like regulatory domain-containing protein [Acidobacteria bacterium]|nr:carboxypeptidase-like regulatory domain-containing protein [Acidobacteriota bacterium]